MPCVRHANHTTRGWLISSTSNICYYKFMSEIYAVPNDPPSLPTPGSYLIYPDTNPLNKFSKGQKITFGFIALLAITVLPVTLVAIGVQTQTQSRAAVSNMPICDPAVSCVQDFIEQPIGTIKCLQTGRSTAVPSWCCPTGQVITNGECRLPFCEEGRSCVQILASQPSGSSKCVSTSNQLTFWCCPAGQSITNGHCLKK